MYGLTAALHGAITLDGGAVQQSNFHDYPLLTLAEMPVVFALTEKRVRSLPIARG